MACSYLLLLLLFPTLLQTRTTIRQLALSIQTRFLLTKEAILNVIKTAYSAKVTATDDTSLYCCMILLCQGFTNMDGRRFSQT